MLRILIAEDNPINQKVVTQMLEKIGYTAEIVDDGIEAVVAARRCAYDVILMDVMMPNMDGMEAARQIRENESYEHRAYIIALTAKATGADRLKCLDAGMDDYISKPFMLEVLREKIETAAAACQRGESEAINRSHLRSFVEMIGDDDPAFIQELLTDYLVDAERMRVELHRALEEGDASAINRIGHTLKSSSAVFGALLLVDICEDFEQYGERGDLDKVRRRLSHFDAALRNVHNALRRVAETGLV